MSNFVVLVSGWRHWRDEALIWSALDLVHHTAHTPITALVHGACHMGGADWIADRWAIARGIAVRRVPVDPKLDGPWPAAGNRRNGRMLLENGDIELLVAFPQPGSERGGTHNMIARVRAAGGLSSRAATGIAVWQPYD